MNEDSPGEQASKIESYGEWANMGAPSAPSTLGLGRLSQNPLLTLAPGKEGQGFLGPGLLSDDSKELSHWFPYLAGHFKLCLWLVLSEMLGPGGSWEVSQVKERKEGPQEWGDLEPGNDGNQTFPRDISNPKRVGVV